MTKRGEGATEVKRKACVTVSTTFVCMINPDESCRFTRKRNININTDMLKQQKKVWMNDGYCTHVLRPYAYTEPTLLE